MVDSVDLVDLVDFVDIVDVVVADSKNSSASLNNLKISQQFHDLSTISRYFKEKKHGTYCKCIGYAS